MKPETEHTCPIRVRNGFEILGKCWTIDIVFVLQDGPKRFNQLLTSTKANISKEEGAKQISNRMLTKRLKEMEEAGLIERQLASKGSAVLYKLTSYGQCTKSVIEEMDKWVR